MRRSLASLLLTLSLGATLPLALHAQATTDVNAASGNQAISTDVNHDALMGAVPMGSNVAITAAQPAVVDNTGQTSLDQTPPEEQKQQLTDPKDPKKNPYWEPRDWDYISGQHM